MIALLFTARIWLANRLLDLAWAVLPADLADERDRINRLSRLRG